MAQSIHSLHATQHFITSNMRKGENIDTLSAKDDHSFHITCTSPTHKVPLLTDDPCIDCHNLSDMLQNDLKEVEYVETPNPASTSQVNFIVTSISNQQEEHQAIFAPCDALNVGLLQPPVPPHDKLRVRTSICRRRSPSKVHQKTSLSWSIHGRRRSYSSVALNRNQISRRHTLLSYDSTSEKQIFVPRPVLNQLVLRVRDRAIDGVPEIVIHQKRRSIQRVTTSTRQYAVYTPTSSIPRQFSQILDWLTCQQPLATEQHALMLRQLRYDKSVMHEHPWAKARLRDLLTLYTVKNEITKEALFPQLAHLNSELQKEIEMQEKKQRVLLQRKQNLTVRLRIASQLVNNIPIVKFGRRGKPHQTYLVYDLKDPLSLFWFRKNGEKSEQPINLYQMRVQLPPSEGASCTDRKRMKVFSMRKSCKRPSLCCFSLMSQARTLDLAVPSLMHREWLLSGLKDLIQFAAQYERALTSMEKRDRFTLRRM